MEPGPVWFFTKAIMSPLSKEIVRQFPCLESEIEKLRDTLSRFRDVVTGAEKDPDCSWEIRKWLRDLKAELIDLDDLVDDVCVEAQRLESKPKEVCFFSFDLPYTLSMYCKLKVIGKRLNVVAKRADHGPFPNPREEVDESWPGHAERTHSIVGREAFKNGIVRHLLDSKVAQDVTVFPIFGIAGMGKTTLAQLVFHDVQIMKHFEPRMWVYVSDEFCLKVILERILESTTNEKRENLKMNKLMEKFQKEILAKRCLIVLEDVLKLDPKEWVEFTNLLSVAARGSSVLVTTPIEDVAKEIAKGTDLDHYTLKSLDLEESWDLFKEIAFKKEQEVEGSELMDIGKKTVEKCAGVPLAIKTVGSLLYFKNPTEWSSLMKKLAEICENKNSLQSTLELCYDDLPAHLKLCFAHCALFPKDYEFDVQKLINLWMAQGFIVLDQSQPLEDVGYEYFMSLVQRSFFYAIEKDEFGIIRRCRMHDLLHNVFADSVADVKSMLSKAFISEKIDKSILHLSFSINFDFMHHNLTPLLKGNRVRTFLLPSESQLSYKEKMGDSTCYKIISSFKLLRALDLHALGIKTVPTSICKLKHLRYLDLSQNSIQMLPHSVTRLQNLQTLKLSDCHLLKELPTGIKKLINLRHLEIDGCWSLTHMPLGMGELTSLQTLPRFVLSEKCQSVSSRGGGLSELNKLNELKRNLEILNLEHLNDAVLDNETANMGEKKNLQELRLRWTRGSNKDEMQLDCLQPHPNLKKLYVSGFGGVKFSSWISLLPNLIEFTLFDIPNCQCLPPLDQLPYLKYLSLNSMSSLEYVSACDNILFSSTPSSTSTPFFPSLETLTLNDLPNLKEWWKMDGILGDNAVETPVAEHHKQHQLHEPLPSFPHLSNLSICVCPKLNSMPRFPYLQELVLQNASLKPLVETVMMIDMAGPNSPKKALTTSTFSSSTLASSSFSPLSDLKSMSISRMDDLEYLPKECLQNLTSLKKLGILFCPRLKSLSPVLQYLSSLEHLQIENCNEFDLSNYGLQWEALGSLNSLLIGEIPKLVALPKELTYVHTLTDLRIRKCSNLVTLLERMESFSSLQHLSIVECPNLVSLPEGMGKLTALQALKISGSSLISQKCKREIGKDWPKIKHIPYVEIDYIRHGRFVSDLTSDAKETRTSYTESKKNI